MTAKLIFGFILTSSAIFAADAKDPLAQCHYLRNPSVAPLIYLAQSEIAVIAHYSSSVDYAKFKARQQTDFYIIPICYIKGYSAEMDILVRSGTQKCAVTELSPLVEYPSLFFLRRDPSDRNRWLLLNGGEYQHQVDTSGLLFGVGVGYNEFPKICGLQRRRIPIDEGKCNSANCRAYCNFPLAPMSNCIDKFTEMARWMTKEDLPADVSVQKSATSTKITQTIPTVKSPLLDIGESDPTTPPKSPITEKIGVKESEKEVVKQMDNKQAETTRSTLENDMTSSRTGISKSDTTTPKSPITEKISVKESEKEVVKQMDNKQAETTRSTLEKDMTSSRTGISKSDTTTPSKNPITDKIAFKESEKEVVKPAGKDEDMNNSTSESDGMPASGRNCGNIHELTKGMVLTMVSLGLVLRRL